MKLIPSLQFVFRHHLTYRIVMTSLLKYRFQTFSDRHIPNSVFACRCSRRTLRQLRNRFKQTKAFKLGLKHHGETLA